MTTVALQLAAILLAFGYYSWHWGSFRNFGAKFDTAFETLFCDYVAHFYPTGAEVGGSNLPARGYYYTPVLAVLVAPLSRLPLPAATTIWGILQALLGLLLCLLPPHWKPGCRRWMAVLFSALMALCVPLVQNFKWGQVSTILNFLILLAFVLHARGRRALAAVALGLAIGLKLYPALYLLWFAIRRDWRFVALTALAAAGFLLVLPCLFMGVGGTMHFYLSVAHQVRSHGTWIRGNVGSQFFPSAVGRLLGQSGGGARWMLAIVGYLAALLSAALLFLAARRRRVENLSIWAFCSISCSLPFLLMSSWLHYFIYLPIVQVFLLGEVLRCRLPRGAIAAVVGLVILPTAVVSNVIFHEHILGGDARRYAASGYLSLANTALFILCGALLLSRARQGWEATAAR